MSIPNISTMSSLLQTQALSQSPLAASLATTGLGQSVGLIPSLSQPSTGLNAQFSLSKGGQGGSADLMSLVTMMMTMMMSMMQMMMSKVSGTSTAATGTTSTTSTTPTTSTTATTTGTTATASATPRFTADDAKNYILGATQGGKIIQEPSISATYADPKSRFAKIGDTNEFDGVVARIYTAQFAGYGKGIDVVYAPGKDINLIASNIDKAQDAYANLNPEAKLFADVAATYRGDFGNRGPYNHAALKNLLISWGRTDLASKSPVGEPGTDAQSIGAVVQALNEQPDQATRKAWMQQIFDFQNNTPSSPSGAVPDLANYQKAITYAKAGLIDKLMVNYNNGVGTKGSVDALLNSTASTTTTTGTTTAATVPTATTTTTTPAAVIPQVVTPAVTTAAAGY